jgi:hypothetical protein
MSDEMPGHGKTTKNLRRIPSAPWAGFGHDRAASTNARVNHMDIATPWRFRHNGHLDKKRRAPLPHEHLTRSTSFLSG